MATLMHVLLRSRVYHSGHLHPAEVHANPQKLHTTHGSVRTPHQNPNQHPSYYLPSPVSSPPFSIHPSLYPMDPSRKVHHPIHPPPVYPAPRTSIFPAPAAERFAPSPTGDQRSIHLHPRSPLHPPTFHTEFVVLPRSYPTVALRRVLHPRHQTSHLCPSLLPPPRTRTLSLKQYRLWKPSSFPTPSGRTSTLEPICMAN